MKTPDQIAKQTSASDRYEAARKALSAWPDADRDDREAEDAVVDALRALITPPSVGESEEVIAERIADRAGIDWDEAYDVALLAVRAGIQSAHGAWESADRPSQEQMLRWLGIDCTIHAGNIFIPEQHIERED